MKFGMHNVDDDDESKSYVRKVMLQLVTVTSVLMSDEW